MDGKKNVDYHEEEDVLKRKLSPFTKEDNPHGVVADTSFATIFPKYREEYIRECFPLLEQKLNEYGIKISLDAFEGTLTVCTSKAVWDPYIIVKARDVIHLIARSVPYEQAIRVLDDGIACDIIKISGMTSSPDTFVKRRGRLVGPNGSTLKAIELVTNCYVLVQGRTVSAIGSYKGLREVRGIVENTMKNIHPIYDIKRLMIIRELEKNPELEKDDWSRFLPKFQSKSVPRKKPHIKKKKPYTPFPPPQPESKVDQELASGEYFLTESEKRAKKMAQKNEQRKLKSQQRQQEKKKSFIPPKEELPAKRKTSDDGNIDVQAFKKKIKLSQKRKGLPRPDVTKKAK